MTSCKYEVTIGGGTVVEAGVIAGYVIVWGVCKARQAAGQVNDTVNTVIDAGVDHPHETATAKLAGHPVLTDLDEETTITGNGQVSELTRQQVEQLVLAAAVPQRRHVRRNCDGSADPPAHGRADRREHYRRRRGLRLNTSKLWI